MANLIYCTCIFVNIIPINIYIIYLLKKTYSNYFNYLFFLNFLCFIFFILIIYLFFLIIFSLFIFFNIWRYLKFFKKLGHAVYFKKLSIYFSFWQYIILYIYKYIYNIICYIYIYIYNIICYIYNKYFFKIIIKNFLIIILKKYLLYMILNLYNYIIILKKLFFNLKFIEFFYYIYSFFFFFKKKDLNNKFLDDPILFRNKFLKLYTNMNYYINIIINTNYYIKKKKKIYIFFFFLLEKYIKILLYKNFNNKIFIYFLKSIYNNKLKILFYIIKKYIIYFFISIYFIVLNFIYIFIKVNIYMFFYLFLFIKIFINKNKKILKIIIFLFLIFYFYWIINYFFFLLYKHYTLYLPLFNVKENLHFINFEWIDLRSYFNVIKLHDTLIDLNVYNNFFYNNAIKQLNLKLNKYNFKFSHNFNINLNLEENCEKININKETVLLNNIFEKWNRYHGAKFIRRWRKYKRMLNWSLRNMFKGKDWYRAIKREKLKGSNLTIFNNGRYFENSKTEISNNIGFWDNLHQIKRLPYSKDIKAQFQKIQAWYAYFKKRHASKKKPRFLISTYIKLKNIPLNNIYKELNMLFLEQYKIKKIKEINFKFELYLKKTKEIEKVMFLFKKLFINLKLLKYKSVNSNIFFFKKYYRSFINEQKKFIWKNKMPTLLITEMRLQRMPPINLIDRQFNDYISMSHTDEMHQYIYYKDLSKKGCLKNVFFKIRYINKKYPYRINKKKNYYQYLIKNYFNLTNTGIKILKKYYFFERSKLRNFNKLSHRLLNKIDTVYSNQLLKYKYWDKIFFLNRLNKKALDFWSFFDYLKVNKYKLLNNQKNFTIYFIEHWKKDYYHMRIYLLRIISFLHYYTVYKKVKMNNSFSFFGLLKNIKIEGTPIGLESLSSLNSFKYLNSFEKINDDNIMSQNKEQEQINEALFYHFKLRWHFKELLNPSGIDSFGNKDKFMYFINLFFKKFNKYFIEYNKINKYNDKYKYKVKSYKIKVLRKIKNLKKFFHHNTKRNKGYRLFSYINTFSIEFHLKHLLWHSPYSFFFFKKNNLIKNTNFDNYFLLNYLFKKKIIIVNDYSYIFNLLLNIIDIKEDWAFYLTDNNIFLFNKSILSLTFYYCYNYGNFFFFYLNEIDIFRIFIILLKNYYNNFLIKLIRFKYLWNKNDYNISTLFIRYIKHWYNSIYLKIRYFIYQTHETYVRYIKRKYLHIIRKKYWIRNHVDCIPFWFIFDYYIKCLIKYLFNKYFIKYHFIIWWLNYRLNLSYYFFFWLSIKKYQYFNIININHIFHFYKNEIYDLYYYFLYLFNYNIIILNWYINLILNNFILLIFIEYNIHLLEFLYKIIFFNYYYVNIKLNIINILNLILNLKYLLYFKFNIHAFLEYILKFLLNIKNKIIYFKSNYYFYKKQKLIRKRKRRIPLTSLLSTNLKRNWFSLKSRSSNFFVFHNFYLLNIKLINLNKNDINLYHFYLIVTNTLPFIKKKLFKNNIYMLFLLYIIFFIIIFIINKKYFKIFFINNKYNKLDLDLDFKLKIKKNNNTFNNYLNLNKKNLYIYKFFLFKFKSWKIINSIKFYNFSRFKWFKLLFNLKNKLNYNSFDKFNKNKPIYKSIFCFINFININKLNNYLINYTKFFLIKKIPFINIFNDYLMFYNFNLKKENIWFKYQKLTMDINFNYIIFYWIFLIPYFFLQYILIKYHLKLYMKTKRRIFYFLRTFLDNIRLFVKINKYLGRSFFKSIYKSKRWKDPSHVFLSKKRSKRNHFSTNNLRYRKLFYRLSPIGSYYYWFAKINVIQYIFSYKNFFLKTTIKSYYYCWWLILYIIILIYLINKHINIIIYNKLKLFTFFKK